MILRILKKVIKHLLGKPQYVTPIFDKTQYPSILGSAGGSLYESNVLVITNITQLAIIRGLLEKERCNIFIIQLDSVLTQEKLSASMERMVGKCDHVINLFHLDDSLQLLVGEKYNDNDLVSLVYQSLKVEADALVDSQYATITTAVLGNETIESKIITATIKACVEGLGKALGNHGLICNGVYVNGEGKLDEMVKMSIYLSSKYGQILAGQMIELGNGKFKN